MKIVRPFAMFVLGLSVTTGVLNAQGASGTTQSRTRAIAASFSKFKNVSKSRRGITKEKYMKVVSEPAVKSSPIEYSGVYEHPDMDFRLSLNVDANGVVTGSGYEPLSESVKRTFTLRNAKIEGALLTATKVYAGGETERLEGAFMNRTASESPTDSGRTVFGFGTLVKPIYLSGNTIDKIFLEKAR
jgi:hypothetical protein